MTHSQANSLYSILREENPKARWLEMSENDALSLFSSILEVPEERIRANLDHSLESLGWDSLSTLELLAKLDSIYGVELQSDMFVDDLTFRGLLATLSAGA
jgi:acyl carrier protein